jgi:hypothetical protein
MIKWIFLNFGLPGLIGMGLGYWLLGTRVKSDGNVLGQSPWQPGPAAGVGGVVFGFAIWLFIGFILRFHGMSINY